jgi:hypothetical protein
MADDPNPTRTTRYGPAVRAAQQAFREVDPVTISQIFDMAFDAACGIDMSQEIIRDLGAVYDRAYKLGWIQACREWSMVSTNADRVRMNKREREMESYDRK